MLSEGEGCSIPVIVSSEGGDDGRGRGCMGDGVEGWVGSCLNGGWSLGGSQVVGR